MSFLRLLNWTQALAFLGICLFLLYAHVGKPVWDNIAGEIRIDGAWRDLEQAGLSPGDVIQDCDDCPELVVLPPGKYRMGNLDEPAAQTPPHDVWIGYAMAVGKYEVSEAQFAAFANEVGLEPDEECRRWAKYPQGNSGTSGTPEQGIEMRQFPVVCITWQNAQDYIAWLSSRTGEEYSLLSSAEWEYAARAGTSTRYWWGDSAKGSGRENCAGCSSDQEEEPAIKEVGQYSANPFGLSDMNGNVSEWIEDCPLPKYNITWRYDLKEGIYLKKPWPRSGPVDGEAVFEEGDCSFRKVRGGSWQSLPILTSSYAEQFVLMPEAQHLFVTTGVDLPEKAGVWGGGSVWRYFINDPSDFYFDFRMYRPRTEFIGFRVKKIIRSK